MSAVRNAENQLAVAQREMERTETLVKAGALAARDLDVARRHVTAAEAQLADAKSRLASADRQLADTVLRAPIDGVIAKQPGEHRRRRQRRRRAVHHHRPLVDAAGSVRARRTICRSLSRRRHRGFHRPRLRPAVRRADPTMIAPQADPVTRQVPIFVSIPNVGGRLVAGLFAEGRVVSQSAEGLVVPVNAVNTTGPDAVGAARRTAERPNAWTCASAFKTRGPSACWSSSGVNEGDMLLRGAAQGITPGTPVTVSVSPDDSEVIDMFISDTAIKRPVLTIVAMLILVVFGIVALTQLDTDEFPEIDAPIVVIAIPYPGASPDNVEREVIEPIEEVISGISGVDRMRSSSLDGFGNIIVEFVFEKDPRWPRRRSATRFRASATICRRKWRSRSSRGSTRRIGRSSR